MGCNFVRLSHYPQHPEFLNACDELGLLVYAELASWKRVREGRWLRNAARQLAAMILRDRNRPCVVVWGLGNESRSRQAYRTLKRVAQELDPHRPVSYAENHYHRARKAKVLDVPDVGGCNDELKRIEEGAAGSRWKCAIVTECCNQPTAERGCWTEVLQQMARIERNVARCRARPFVAGFVLWSFNDYPTLRKKWYQRYSGVVDAWRVPQLSAALVRALGAEEPCVTLAGDWGVGRGPTRREIHVVTNCDEVALHCGPELVCRLLGRPHHVVRVGFREVPLVAYGQRAGRDVTDGLIPFDAPVSLRAWWEGPARPALPGETLAFCVEVCDECGRRVGDWNGDVVMRTDKGAQGYSFTPEGTLVVREGMGRGWVTALRKQGMVRVQVEHLALKPVVLERSVGTDVEGVER